MSTLSRLIQHLPASRRAYSSFFSSKPGGGRYFNSAKPPKTPVVATGKNSKTDSSSQDSQAKDAADGASSQKSMRSATADSAQSSSAPSSSASSSTSGQACGAFSDVDTQLSSYMGVAQHYTQSHPVVNPKDFKLHQFFSLHRPLLLLSHPPAILESAPAHTVFSSSGPELKPQQQQQQRSTSPFDDVLDASVDADAEAARQLTRALTMNMAGATMAWEDTLRRLGLDVDQQPDRIGLQQQWDKEWQDVMLDSVKRKRRKKMKKHKLRKRRKATRASRLKLK